VTDVEVVPVKLVAAVVVDVTTVVPTTFDRMRCTNSCGIKENANLL
jgi:hypothetical protein